MCEWIGKHVCVCEWMFDHVGVTMFKSSMFMSENVTVSTYVRMCEWLCVYDHIWQVNEHSHTCAHEDFNCVSCSVMSESLQPHGLQGSSVHKTLQTRVLVWVAIPFTVGSSWHSD